MMTWKSEEKATYEGEKGAKMFTRSGYISKSAEEKTIQVSTVVSLHLMRVYAKKIP